jgi:class 3 adenylate cyclase
MKTKHLTIMFTDIKGFTPRTSRSSREQLKKLLELHDELICPFFNEFGGKIIKTIGDAFLVTFHSPTDAVLCGMKIQKELAKYNEKVPIDEKLEIRIAINSGEVAVRKGDVFGEAVNIAARLEGIAEPGDIYFTEAVYLAMNKAEIPTAEIGYRHFKGIPEEVKVYKVLSQDIKKGLFGKKEKAYKRELRKTWKYRLKKIGKWALIIFLVLFVLGLLSNGNKQQSQDTEGQSAIDQVNQLKQDAEDAFETGDQATILDKINALNDLSRQYNNPPELETLINNLESAYERVYPS